MKIEKNIPVPDSAKANGRPKIYPLDKMEVGDSFLADGKCADNSLCKAMNAARRYGKRHGMKFSGRKDPDQPGKVRIWRVA